MNKKKLRNLIVGESNMFGKKKQKNFIPVKLTDKSIEFIKSVIIPELNINTPITTSEICKIEDWIYNLEDMQYDEEGNEIHLDHISKEKLLKAQELLAELMGIWGNDNTVEDLDDLNNRLNLQ